MTSRKPLTKWTLLALVAFSTTRLFAQGTAFTYQGRLADNGTLPNANYDMKFTLYGSLAGPDVVAGPIIKTGPTTVAVNGGLFTTTLDFGVGVFTGPDRFLKIEISPAGQNTYTALSARQQLTPSPYAITAGNLAPGTGLAGTYSSAVTFNNAANTFTGNGSALTSLNAANVGSGTLADARLSANIALLNRSPQTFTGQNIFSSSGVLGTTFQEKIQFGSFTLALGANPTAAEVQSQGGVPLYINHNGNNVILLDGVPGYNVGIGTSNPGGTLSLFNSTSDTIFKLEDRRADASSSFLSKQAFYDYYSESAYVGLRHNGGLSPGVRALVFGVNAANSGSASEKMRIDVNGNVGIGTPNPLAPLDLASGFGTHVIRFSYDTDEHHSISTWFSGDPQFDSLTFNLNQGPGVGVHAVMSLFGNGRTLIQASNTTSGSILDLRNLAPMPNNETAGTILFTDVNGAPKGQITCGGFDGTMAFSTGVGTRMMTVAPGVVTVPVLQINGADVAEPFELSSQNIAMGSVVVIDEANPGKVKLSERAYDKRVAGILSGANGVNSGILLKQQGFNDRGQNVALSGRVYAFADASFAAINPGDLLTTSDTPGHCMKASNHARAQGAIIGKAMSSLAQGKGMVLVLVSLQ